MFHKSERHGLILTAFLALAVTVTLAACGGGDDDDDGGPTVVFSSRTPAPTTPVPRRTFTPTPTPSPTPLQVCAPNPNPAPTSALQVLDPEADGRYKIPVFVRGWGSNIGEDDRGVFVAVVDARQSILQINEVPPQPREFRVAPPGLEITDFTRPFAIDLVIPDVTDDTPYCIWVYQSVDEDGRAQSVVQVPVVIEPR